MIPAGLLILTTALAAAVELRGRILPSAGEGSAVNIKVTIKSFSTPEEIERIKSLIIARDEKALRTAFKDAEKATLPFIGSMGTNMKFGIGRNIIHLALSRIGNISSPYVSMKGRQNERVFPLLVGGGTKMVHPSKWPGVPGFSGAEVLKTRNSNRRSRRKVAYPRSRGAKPRKRSPDFALIDIHPTSLENRRMRSPDSDLIDTHPPYPPSKKGGPQNTSAHSIAGGPENRQRFR